MSFQSLTGRQLKRYDHQTEQLIIRTGEVSFQHQARRCTPCALCHAVQNDREEARRKLSKLGSRNVGPQETMCGGKRPVTAADHLAQKAAQRACIDTSFTEPCAAPQSALQQPAQHTAHPSLLCLTWHVQALVHQVIDGNPLPLRYNSPHLLRVKGERPSARIHLHAGETPL